MDRFTLLQHGCIEAIEPFVIVADKQNLKYIVADLGKTTSVKTTTASDFGF